MYTIHQRGGLHLSDHPIEGGKVAYLYHHKPHAERHIDQAADSPDLAIAEIPDLTGWLTNLRSQGIAHVFEALPTEDDHGAPVSNMHNVLFRLSFIQLGLETFD